MNKLKKKGKLHVEQWHILAGFLAVYDLIAVSAAYLLSLWIRFDGSFTTMPEEYLESRN